MSTMKKVMVISLGGSLIVPEKMDVSFLKKLHTTLKKFYKTHSFVIVCGGGVVARKYIGALRQGHYSEKDQSLAGIQVTCLNAKFMMEWFGKEANLHLPKSPTEVKNLLKKNNIVFTCAFRYVPHSTSDSNAAHLAYLLKSDFINLSNVDELYTADPRTHKNAKPISRISWKDFEHIALKHKYKAGQHFLLDQSAATFIRKHKIKTYLLGKKLTNLSKVLKEEKFTGTLIGP